MAASAQMPAVDASAVSAVADLVAAASAASLAGYDIDPPTGLAQAAFARLNKPTSSDLLGEEVAWQRVTMGEAAKIETFKNEVLNHEELVVFVFMKADSPFLHFLHSPATYHMKGG